ncbi:MULTISPECIES: hypothetical protein [Streptomyces]|uniref:DUF3592 domain-containing protein n=2 Tax=Streptomyces TaxID=1883 RepID=A0ABU4KJ25_9ACTN|nr:hypothetical protein [Streptomyces roseolus]MDX2297798.1 hypothetical protein [Streptomyces roseolus]
MPIPLASLPVLVGRDGIALSVENEGLVLDLPTEQIVFTADGLGRLRAEGGTVLIELRARAGATPRVHRIDDVDPDGAALLVDTINDLLANRTDRDDVDGARFAAIRSLAPRWRHRFARRVRRGVLGYLLALVVLAVVAGSLGHWDVVIVEIGVGGISGLALGFGTYGVGDGLRERWLRRHGVAVTATRATSPGAYVYPDGTGDYRIFVHGRAGAAITAYYPPGDPADVDVPLPPFTRLVRTIGGGFLLACGIAGTVALAALTVTSFSTSGGL